MTFRTVYARDLVEKQKEENALVVDIRSRQEYYRGHFSGAIVYPYEENEKWGMKLPIRRTLILYCEHGGTSMQAARKLGRKGYRVYTVIGGYEAIKKNRRKLFQKSGFCVKIEVRQFCTKCE